MTLTELLVGLDMKVTLPTKLSNIHH